MTGQSSNSYFAAPPSGTGPGVLVLHPWWGLNQFIRDLCDRLAQRGFVTLAPDMYSGKIARTIEEAEQLISQWNEAEEAPPIVLRAVEELSRNPAVTGNGLGVIGLSMGAAWVLWLAQAKPELIRAVTLFYGTNGGEGDFQPSKAAFLGHFAEADPYETAETVAAMEKALQEAHRPVTFYTYPGTGHWFLEEDRQDAYNAQAAQLAWERTIAFLRDELES